MTDPNDVRALRVVRTELTKRGIDINRADVRVAHGICYLRGTIAALKHSSIQDLDTEIHHVMRIIRQRPEIRDIVFEGTLVAS